MGIFTRDNNQTPAARLAELTRVVTENITGFMKAGTALAMIRDEQLYRVTHQTFADFTESTWGINARRAYQLIASAAAADRVKELAHAPNDYQALKLSTVPPPLQPAAWQETIETAPQHDGQPHITAAHVEEIAKKYRSKKKQARVKKPRDIVLRGKGWKIILRRASLAIDAGQAIDQAREQYHASKSKAA